MTPRKLLPATLCADSNKHTCEPSNKQTHGSQLVYIWTRTYVHIYESKWYSCYVASGAAEAARRGPQNANANTLLTTTVTLVINRRISITIDRGVSNSYLCLCFIACLFIPILKALDGRSWVTKLNGSGWVKGHSGRCCPTTDNQKTAHVACTA